MRNERRPTWRVDLISKSSATQEQLEQLPKEHKNLRRFNGRVIGLLERFQHCGNVSFDYTPTLAHYLPNDLKGFTELFEPYLVFDTPSAAEVQYEDHSLRYRATVCGDNGQPLRGFTEGTRIVQPCLASKPGETVWHIHVTLSFTRYLGSEPKLWYVQAIPTIASSYEGRWYVDTAFWRNGKKIRPEGGSWLSEPEQLAEFPWMLPLIKKAKDIIRQDPRVPEWCRKEPQFAS